MFSVGFAIVVISGFAAAAVLGQRIRRGTRRTELLSGLLTLDAVVLARSVCAIGLALLPDARDRLTPADRSRADSAMSVALLCGEPLLSHTTAVVVSSDRRRVDWTCAWGPLGLLQASGSASCSGGMWEGPGFGGPTYYGPCA